MMNIELLLMVSCSEHKYLASKTMLKTATVKGMFKYAESGLSVSNS